MEEIFRYFEFAEEKTRGKPEQTAEMSCDALSVSPGIPDNPEMEFSGSMGRGKTIHRPGFYTTSPSFEIGTDLPILSRLLYLALGEQIFSTNENNKSTDEKTFKSTPTILYFQNASNKFYPYDNGILNIPGHSKTETDDYIVMGMSKPFTSINFNVNTARTDECTLNYEYWDGKKWTELPISSGWISSGDTSKKFEKIGEHTLSFEKPEDWEKTSINSSKESYFIRVKCSQFQKEGIQGQIQNIVAISKEIPLKQFIYSTNKIFLPSFTGFFGMDLNAFQIPGLVLDKLELSVENEFITLKGDMQGMKESIIPLKKENELKMNPDYPLAFYEANVYMRDRYSNQWDESTLISPDIKKFNLSISNSAKADDGQGLGSRFPYKIPVGERTIELSFDYEYLTRKWYDLMQGGENGPQENKGSTEFELMLAFDAGRFGRAQFHFPRVIITSASVDSKGRDPITQSISIDAYMDWMEIPSKPVTKVYTDILYAYEPQI